MRILKAYERASAAGAQGYNHRQGFAAPVQAPGEQAARVKDRLKAADRITLSDEALRMLENGGDALHNCPQDATYDQFGNVTRQFDSIQNDLRSLASQFMSSPANSGMLGRISSLRSQVAALEATV